MQVVFIIIAVFTFISLVVKIFGLVRFKGVVDLFKKHNVITFGSKGSGKDLLFSNVCAYRNQAYCSNMNYMEGNDKAPTCYPFNPVYIKLGGNMYRNFAEHSIIPYDYPLPDNCDYYISDAGVYFPSQECSDLNRRYPEIPMFQALSRHLGDCRFHCNTQALNRIWDKIREQADIYILCKKCSVKRGVVKQTLIIYDRYQSALDKVEPFKAPVHFLGKQVKNDTALKRADFRAKYGQIKKVRVRYRLRSNYDSRRFKYMLYGNTEVV